MDRAPNRRQPAPPAASQSFTLETLEPRAMLAATPLPDIMDLQSPNHSVVRFQVNFGGTFDDVDIEMYDSEAPTTVANFLKYVRDGDYDKTFFHRLALNNDSTPFVLQGGLGRLRAPTNTGPFIEDVETVPTDAPIQNEYNNARPNAPRTIAMAKVGGQPNSATSQFFLNISDNSTVLNQNNNGGFTVFGRVLDDRSWAVITAISQLTRSTQASPYNEIPVAAGFSGSNVAENQLVTIVDVELIKPQGTAEFFGYRYYFPEGFAGGAINEFIPMGNTGSTTLAYQVVVRAESRDARPAGNVDFWYRDKVIDFNTIAPGRRAGFTTSTFANPDDNLVPRQGKPYAYEVWSTSPVAITLSHYDFGFSTIESFVGGVRTFTGQAASTTNPGPSDGSNTTWAIPDIRKGSGNSDFILWQNTTDRVANVTVRFIIPGQAPVEQTFPTEAFRRGGLNLNDIPQLPAGAASAILTSDQPIVAALSHYKTTTGGKGASTQAGIAGAGSRIGIIPLANINANATITDEVSFLNPNVSAAIVTLIATFDDATPDFTTTQFMASESRMTINLGSFDALKGKRFSLRYTSGIQSVYASVLHIENEDVASNQLAIRAAPIHEFGEGFININSTDVFEQLGIFNPNDVATRGMDVNANVTITFSYTDGTVVTKNIVVLPGRRVELILDQDTELRAQNMAGRFFYSIRVSADVPVVAMGRHYDLSLGGTQPSGGGSTIGTQFGTFGVPVVRLDLLSTI